MVPAIDGSIPMTHSDEVPNGENLITVSHVSDDKRLAFLPNLFGVRAMLYAEGAVFSWAKSISQDYARQGGGYWEFYTTSNGCGFMVPEGLPELIEVTNPMNFYQGAMTKEAFGITCTILAFGVALERFRTVDLRDKQELLKDFAEQHAESKSIFAAID